MSWNWITDRIAIGSGPSPSDVPAMQRDGITDVLDLRGEPRQGETGPQPEMYNGSGIRYHYVGMLDRGGAQPAEKYQEGVQVMYNALTQPNTRVLVQCSAGQYRSPSMVYAYLRSTGMSADDAWSEIVTHRPVARQQYFPSVERALASLPHGPSASGGSVVPLAIAAAVMGYLLLR